MLAWRGQLSGLLAGRGHLSGLLRAGLRLPRLRLGLQRRLLAAAEADYRAKRFADALLGFEQVLDLTDHVVDQAKGAI